MEVKHQNKSGKIDVHRSDNVKSRLPTYIDWSERKNIASENQYSPELNLLIAILIKVIK